jgi:hypothetical protein
MNSILPLLRRASSPEQDTSSSLCIAARAAYEAATSVFTTVADCIAGGGIDTELLHQLGAVAGDHEAGTLTPLLLVPPMFTMDGVEPLPNCVMSGALVQAHRICVQLLRRAWTDVSVDSSEPSEWYSLACRTAVSLGTCLAITEARPLTKSSRWQPEEHASSVLAYARAATATTMEFIKKTSSQQVRVCCVPALAKLR